MAGLRGNEAWLMAARQTAKGTPAVPAANTTFKMPFSGGNIAPVRETDRLSETDSSRDQGDLYVVSSGVEGSPEVYTRDDSIGLLLLGVLGADAVTGTTPNYTHVFTPSNTLPYMTFWRNISSTLYEQFQDCMVGSLAISAEAGAPLTATAGVQGLVPTRLETDPSVTPAIPLSNGAVYNFNDASVTLNGDATALVRSFELTVENNVSRQQTDDVTPYDVVPGIREISLGFDMIFEDIGEYNRFQYGATGGTIATSQVAQAAATFTFNKGTNNSISFDLPRIAYEEMPVEPNPGGDPIVVSVRAVGVRGGTPILTATIKNQVALY